MEDMVTDEMGLEFYKDTYEKAIGEIVVEYINKFRPYELSPVTENAALRLISKIRDILDDDNLEDQECFYRIDEIVKAFDESGVYTHRHDW